MAEEKIEVTEKKPEAQPQTEVKAKVEAKPAEKPKAEAKPEAKPMVEAKPQLKAEVKPEAKPTVEAKAEAEAKPVAKKPAKPEEKPAVKAAPKPKPKKEKPKPEPKIKGSKEVQALKKLVKKKVKLPSFHGRFGTRSLRSASKAKWAKWRKPRGIDIYRQTEDGAWPQMGYRTNKKVRGLHPSGFEEVRVFNTADLTKLNPDMQAARIAGTVGKKKRMEIRAKAKEMKLRLLNR